VTAPLSPRLLLPLIAVALAFLASLAAFSLRSRGGGSPSGGPDAAELRREAALPVPAPGESTDSRVADLQRLVRAAPDDPRGYTQLGLAYLQKVRETGDAGFYTRAEGVIVDARRLAPRDPAALAAAGTLALARHDFAGALSLGTRARAAAPASLQAYPVIADAQIELGRYGEAMRTLQAFVDRKPTLAAYARVSYLQELRGEIPAAIEAMRLAVSAGGANAENAAYVRTLLANLELSAGRLAAAEHDYRGALAAYPGYLPARAGLAGLAASRGRLAEAARGYRAVVDRLPLPSYVIALGEVELAAGRRGSAAHDLALVGAQERLQRAGGVNVDVEVALFEASHGSPARGVALARRAWRSAPSVRAADALGWALTRSGNPREALGWARRALALGSRDPSFLYHAGMAALGAGRPGQARAWLRGSLAANPRWSPLYGPRARRALERLGA